MGLFGRKKHDAEHKDYDNRNHQKNLNSESEINNISNNIQGAADCAGKIEENSEADWGDSRDWRSNAYQSRSAHAALDTAEKNLDALRDRVQEEGKDRDNGDRRLPKSPW